MLEVIAVISQGQNDCTTVQVYCVQGSTWKLAFSELGVCQVKLSDYSQVFEPSQCQWYKYAPYSYAN